MVSNVMHTGTVLAMEAVVHETPEDLAISAAGAISDLIASADGRFTLGLAGGSTPTATYERLTEAEVDWGRVDAWLSDERWVAPDDERCNGRMAAEILFDHVDASLHRPRWSEMVEPDDAAAHYEAAVRSIHPDGVPDLILLGMGADGHTASLFPGTEALTEESRWIVANYVPQEEETRLTATYPLLWKAKHILFLVAGESKAQAVRESFDAKTPAGRVGEGTGRVTWHLDAAAASLLS